MCEHLQVWNIELGALAAEAHDAVMKRTWRRGRKIPEPTECVASGKPLLLSAFQCPICKLKLLNCIMMANLDASGGQKDNVER